MTVKHENETDNPSPTKSLSQSQLKQLLQYVSDKAEQARQSGTSRAVVDELIILLLAETGLRPAEFCNLNIEDLPSSPDKNILVVRDSQGNPAREIQVSPKVVELAEKFIRAYRMGAEPKDALLISERGNRFTYRSLYNKVKNIGINSGIGPIYPHILRSTFMVRLFNDVKDLRLVQQQAGHASPKTTAICIGGGFSRKRKSKSQEPDSAANKNDTVKCDACDRLLAGQGRKIESGQILCPDCLKYFQ
ncbi:MAG: tyrosine-type recombinase/integrase [Phycisphaerae bacterium]|nr:tyrosine-type recombinase/integrase [Phycisphaerae bacterium]